MHGINQQQQYILEQQVLQNVDINVQRDIHGMEIPLVNKYNIHDIDVNIIKPHQDDDL